MAFTDTIDFLMELIIYGRNSNLEEAKLLFMSHEYVKVSFHLSYR